MNTPDRNKALWQAAGAAGPDEAIMEFLAGDDIVLDRVLFSYDIRATRAHVRGLERSKLLTRDECAELCKWLDALDEQFRSGRFELDGRFEDGHSAIEYYLTQHAGPLGEKVHTGRSRNDQVLVASRLFLIDALEQLTRLIRDAGSACLDRAEADAVLPMPGYTHLQRAVPSSVGLWLGGFAESFADDLAFARAVRDVIDSNPLGTAAGYGVNLPLDREGVTGELEFARLQINPVAAQLSRGKFEIMALQAASHALHDVQRLAWDLSLFTTAEFGFVALPDRYITGSSIMPNKRNPDVVELLRARPAVVDAAIHEILGIVSLPSGYHRDLQFTKSPMIRGLTATLQAMAIVPGLVADLRFDAERMRAA
ncbi:MAG: argininosuccinate lyase, partial [Xanthomonadales bacterium]|nr:argininosuccinate lyase [Xanthomonadales bacterium]